MVTRYPCMMAQALEDCAMEECAMEQYAMEECAMEECARPDQIDSLLLGPTRVKIWLIWKINLI